MVTWHLNNISASKRISSVNQILFSHLYLLSHLAFNKIVKKSSLDLSVSSLLVLLYQKKTVTATCLRLSHYPKSYLISKKIKFNWKIAIQSLKKEKMNYKINVCHQSFKLFRIAVKPTNLFSQKLKRIQIKFSRKYLSFFNYFLKN